MKVIYVIGPFRAKCMYEIEQNIRVAETMALDLWKEGYAVICPHTNTRFFDGAIEDTIFLDGDKEILLRCDAAIVVGDWKKSLGSVIEINYAKEKNIPVFYNIDKLNSFFGYCK